jgi:hypothetical protein
VVNDPRAAEHREPVLGPAGSSPIEKVARDLARSLTTTLGKVEVRNLERLSGGASRETWSFDAVDASGTVLPLVLRRDPPGRPSAPGAMGKEAVAIALASSAGLAVRRA